jgi:anti-anti-sigma regulatory factor
MLFDPAHTTAQGYLVPIDAWRAGSNRRQLRRLVGEALERGEREIVMDCKAWNSPDVVLLSTLVGCADLCAQQGANFRLVNLDGSMHETLRELRLTSRLGLIE